jgi:hypothetical protein
LTSPFQKERRATPVLRVQQEQMEVQVHQEQLLQSRLEKPSLEMQEVLLLFKTKVH